jgi:formate dehydrogenase assembly factor FdhD
VIGWAFLVGRLPLADTILCVGGRLSCKLMQKTALADCPLLTGVDAPSSRVVELARNRRTTLGGGFVRDGHLNAHREPWRAQS